MNTIYRIVILTLLTFNLHANELKVDGMLFSPLIQEEVLLDRVSAMAGQINRDYEGKSPVFVCVLAGAMPFCTDLMKQVTLPCEVDFIKLSSYNGEMSSSGTVTKHYDLTRSIEGRDVIVVEDIIDTGRSIKRAVHYLRTHNPASIRVASLLWKQEMTTETFDFPLDYIGFTIPNVFVIGYGLDYKQMYRNLPTIYQRTP